MKKRTLYTLLMILCVVGFWVFDNFYTPNSYSDPKKDNSEVSIPEFILPSATSGSVVHHVNYSLSYKEAYEQAEWVAYTLKKEHLTYDDRERPYFIEDPYVKTKSADWRNYKRSGYDRGHLCPAGDRRFSEFAYNETFYTSNIVPQRNDFNAGVWNRLEMQTRYWAKKYGNVYVITGGVLKKGLDEIGDEDVAVPNYFYKIIAKGRKDKIRAVAFLFPHRESTEKMQNFLVPIDRLEELTGINFFEKLNNVDEAKLESKIEAQGWKF